jgi:hypothetical protein
MRNKISRKHKNTLKVFVIMEKLKTQKSGKFYNLSLTQKDYIKEMFGDYAENIERSYEDFRMDYIDNIKIATNKIKNYETRGLRNFIKSLRNKEWCPDDTLEMYINMFIQLSKVDLYYMDIYVFVLYHLIEKDCYRKNNSLQTK